MLILVRFALAPSSVRDLAICFGLLVFAACFHGLRVLWVRRLLLVTLLHSIVFHFLVLSFILVLPRPVHRPSAPRRLPSGPAWMTSTARGP